MKKTFKDLVAECTRVYVIVYWFNYDDPDSVVVKFFKNSSDAFSFLQSLDSLGFQKYKFSIAYYKGYFEDDFTFIYED